MDTSSKDQASLCLYDNRSWITHRLVSHLWSSSIGIHGIFHLSNRCNVVRHLNFAEQYYELKENLSTFLLFLFLLSVFLWASSCFLPNCSSGVSLSRKTDCINACPSLRWGLCSSVSLSRKEDCLNACSSLRWDLWSSVLFLSKQIALPLALLSVEMFAQKFLFLFVFSIFLFL